MTADEDNESTDTRRPGEERWTPSRDELDAILEKHRAWLESEGASGEQAVLGGAGLSGAVLLEADLSGAVLVGADLSGALLQGADLPGALLQGADLPGANLHGADLSEAVLWGADLSVASLADATLKDVTGLHARQLRGSDVSNAALPDAIARFEGLGVVKEATQSARKLFISVLVACAYSAIAVATEGAGDAAGLTLPIVNVQIGVADFYLVASVLLALLFGYFHLQMQRVWEEIAELPAIFPDGKPLDKKIHPWPITGIVRAHVEFLKHQPRPPFFPLQRVVAVLLAWGAVPTTLGISPSRTRRITASGAVGF